MSNSLLSLPAVAGERFRSLDAVLAFGALSVRREPGIWQNSRPMISDLAQPEFPLTWPNTLDRPISVIRFLLLIVIMAFLVAGFAQVSHAELVVYVGDRPYASDFDPYFNQPKVYRQPRYYEYTSKKRKGNKVFKTTKVKNQYGRTVYKKTSSHKKKKWK